MTTFANYLNNSSTIKTTALPPKPTLLQKVGNTLGSVADQAGHFLAYNGTKIAQAGVGSVVQPQENSEINQQQQTTAQLHSLLDQINATTNPTTKLALTNAAKALVSRSIPNQQAEENSAQTLGKLSAPTQVLGSSIPAQQSGGRGAEQIGGQALEDVGTIGGLAAGESLNPALKLPIRFLQGAGVGGGSGGLIGAGQAMENGGSLGQVAQGTGSGALGGAIGGGVLNAVLPPVLGKLGNLIKPGEVNDVPKLSPEQQDIQNNITQSQKDLEQAKSKADFAAEQRKNATPQAVEGVKNINNQVSGNIKTLGTEFGNGAAELEKSNPTAKLNLTNEQVEALNNLKENKNFSLPEKIQQAQDARASLPESKFGNIKLTGKALEEFNAGQKATQASLSPTEAQDLIKELNRSTFRQNADGSITKDYQRLGITNEIKKAASEAFGDKWDTLYSKYAQGRGIIDKLDSITNLDPKATPEDLNKQLEGILKQSKTPEGKLLLQQAINEYQQSSGIDLNDPIKSIQQIADKQTALDEANSNLSDAQKASNKAQRDADIAKLKQEQKMSTFKGRHPVLTSNLQFFTKRAAWQLTGGAVIGALGLSALLKKLGK